MLAIAMVWYNMHTRKFVGSKQIENDNKQIDNSISRNNTNANVTASAQS